MVHHPDVPLQLEQAAEHAGTSQVKRTIAQILALSLPALGSVLADPVCSLADTALIGQSAGSVQLAALSPCTAIFNVAFLVRPRCLPSVIRGAHALMLALAPHVYLFAPFAPSTRVATKAHGVTRQSNAAKAARRLLPTPL
jgi:hypothetical protein